MKLRCDSFNHCHVRFTVFDKHGANCGSLCIQASDLPDFLLEKWDVEWNGEVPETMGETVDKLTALR